MRPQSSNDIRRAFLEFFEENGHAIVASSPLPVYDNPTLLFTNAGMNQFVNVFLGNEVREYNRATTSQKCMRVQGKHNDLENVGPSPRHHTFFEMLGNFSFGDYFKREAIRLAYAFMTETCGVDPEKLYFTVHTSDDEAYGYWVDDVGVSADRVLRMGDKTNFWMMGDTGPCGPTSELHYDWGPEACSCGEPNCSVLLDNDCERWLEVWNLVFMQYDQAADGTRTPLPRPGVDTGMGLERITSVVQSTPVNYDNDLFAPAMDMIQELLNDQDDERDEKVVGYRVIADHGRAATFLIADGVLPGNVGAGYVLRMIIRRAARFGRKIGFTGPFLSHVAGVYIDHMGAAYPEVRQRRDLILHTLQQEEERFARTLDTALDRLDEVLAAVKESGGEWIDGETAFNLYATHGLPVEITRDVAGERGLGVDEAGFLRARARHAEASGSGAFQGYETGANVYAQTLQALRAAGRLESGVDYDPYSGIGAESEVLAIIHDGARVDEAQKGDEVEIVTAATPFYVESGGEVSDTGRFFTATLDIPIHDTRRPPGASGLVLHLGTIRRGTLRVGAIVNQEVDGNRRMAIRRNHTATHILHAELRRRLGPHVTQQGSLVAPDRLRFDFSHGQALARETLDDIERGINEAILANHPVVIRFMEKEEAIEAGAMALFGEKYADVVRTITLGDTRHPYSFELCGGLHVDESSDIGLFRFTNETAVAAGVRRVEAVTGEGAYAYAARRLNTLERIAGRFNAPIEELEERLESLLVENKRLQKELESSRRANLLERAGALFSQVGEAGGVPLLTAIVPDTDADGLRALIDTFREKVGSGVVVLATVSDGRPLLVAGVSQDLVQRGAHAGNIIREVAKMVGGGGGGRPQMAQAGGRDPEKLAAALAAVRTLVEQAMTP